MFLCHGVSYLADVVTPNDINPKVAKCSNSPLDSKLIDALHFAVCASFVPSVVLFPESCLSSVTSFLNLSKIALKQVNLSSLYCLNNFEHVRT